MDGQQIFFSRVTLVPSCNPRECCCVYWCKSPCLLTSLFFWSSNRKSPNCPELLSTGWNNCPIKSTCLHLYLGETPKQAEAALFGALACFNRSLASITAVSSREIHVNIYFFQFCSVAPSLSSHPLSLLPPRGCWDVWKSFSSSFGEDRRLQPNDQNALAAAFLHPLMSCTAGEGRCCCPSHVSNKWWTQQAGGTLHSNKYPFWLKDVLSQIAYPIPRWV